MAEDLVGAEQKSACNPCEDFLQLLGSRLELMSRLGASLDRSRQALLALDLAGIERGTREQEGLVREFESVLRRGRALAFDVKAAARDETFALAVATLQQELQSGAVMVRDAALLQAALLVRMQGKLRVLRNMLAGTTALYLPAQVQHGGMAGVRTAQRRRL